MKKFSKTTKELQDKRNTIDEQLADINEEILEEVGCREDTLQQLIDLLQSEINHSHKMGYLESLEHLDKTLQELPARVKGIIKMRHGDA